MNKGWTMKPQQSPCHPSNPMCKGFREEEGRGGGVAPGDGEGIWRSSTIVNLNSELQSPHTLPLPKQRQRQENLTIYCAGDVFSTWGCGRVLLMVIRLTNCRAQAHRLPCHHNAQPFTIFLKAGNVLSRMKATFFIF